ncbi:MAG: GntR family transcriptional regulator [Phycisphaeraceae bacterium]|nr:GntR family transcriptional regulator [Phycisphaeraceae bacterium]
MVNVGNKTSLSSQVAHRIKQKMRQGDYPSGSTLPSIRKLCDNFGVSLSVAHRAIRELEENGIVQTHQGKGTVVQQSDHADRTAILFSFIQPYPAGVDFEQQILQYAEQTFSARDNFMVFRSSRLDTALEREIVEHAINNGVQGILLWPVENNPNGPFFEKLSQKVPIVLVDRLLDNAKLPAVISDTYEVGREICREMLEVRNRKRMLCLIDNLNISPYKMLMQGLRDEAEDMGRSDDMTLVQMGISEFVTQTNNNDFSTVDHYKEKIEKLIHEGDYDTVHCSLGKFFKYVIRQTGLYEKLHDIQWAVFAGPTQKAQNHHANDSNTVTWIIDFPEMISKAADILQRSVLAGNVPNEILTLKMRQSPPQALKTDSLSSLTNLAK